MGRWVLGLLLLLNMALALWGWTRDRPLHPPLPPLAEAPGQILLGSEWLGRASAVTGQTETPPPPSEVLEAEGAVSPDEKPMQDEGASPLPAGPRPMPIRALPSTSEDGRRRAPTDPGGPGPGSGF